LAGLAVQPVGVGLNQLSELFGGRPGERAFQVNETVKGFGQKHLVVVFDRGFGAVGVQQGTHRGEFASPRPEPASFHTGPTVRLGGQRARFRCGRWRHVPARHNRSGRSDRRPSAVANRWKVESSLAATRVVSAAWGPGTSWVRLSHDVVRSPCCLSDAFGVFETGDHLGFGRREEPAAQADRLDRDHQISHIHPTTSTEAPVSTSTSTCTCTVGTCTCTSRHQPCLRNGGYTRVGGAGNVGQRRYPRHCRQPQPNPTTAGGAALCRRLAATSRRAASATEPANTLTGTEDPQSGCHSASTSAKYTEKSFASVVSKTSSMRPV
jgi:hypothetical protein